MAIKLLEKPYLDPSSTTVLVTGSSGYIGGNIVRELLDVGYKVRGTVRSEEKAAKTKETFNSSNYETAIVTDFSKPSDEIANAVKGVDAIIHVASDTTFSDDPKQVIDGVVHGVGAFLDAANNEKSVKRFVLTSSSSAVLLPQPGKELTVKTTTWNEVAEDHAWNKSGKPYDDFNPYPFVVYAASKTAGEQAFWKFQKDKKPHFQQNAVLPNANTGRILSVGGATGNIIPNIYKDAKKPSFSPQYYIDVIDDARLHVIAAVLDESIVDERIFAFAEPFNTTRIAETIIKLRPDSESKLSKLVDPNEPKDMSHVPNELGAKLLKKWYGQDGYTSFEDTVKQNLEGL